MGHGTGAICVEYLVHSPMIRQQHFHRVILMSGDQIGIKAKLFKISHLQGSIFSGHARVEHPSDSAVQLGRALGCSLLADMHTHHTDILECLRKRKIQDIVS